MDKYKLLAIIAGIILILLFVVLSSRYRIIKTYEKYLKVGNLANLTGKELAFLSKINLDLPDLKFALTDVKLGDAYSPKYKTLIISEDVCNTASLASLTIVAHELGHAMQHKNESPLFVANQLFSMFTRFTNKFIIPLLSFGILFYLLKFPNDSLGQIFILISGILFLLHVFKLLLNIPLEYNASNRALKYLKEYNYVSSSEYKKAKKLLSIAAQTYIAGLLDELFIINKKRKKR